MWSVVNRCWASEDWHWSCNTIFLVGTQLNLIHLLTPNGSFSSNFCNANYYSTHHFEPWHLFSDAEFDGFICVIRIA
jgi:hypothetical protein